MTDAGLTIIESTQHNAHVTGRCTLHGLLYLPTNGLGVIFLTIFPATFPDTCGGMLVTTWTYNIPTGTNKPRFPACCISLHASRVDTKCTQESDYESHRY